MSKASIAFYLVTNDVSDAEVKQFESDIQTRMKTFFEIERIDYDTYGAWPKNTKISNWATLAMPSIIAIFNRPVFADMIKLINDRLIENSPPEEKFGTEGYICLIDSNSAKEDVSEETAFKIRVQENFELEDAENEILQFLKTCKSKKMYF